jgi:hypothetical protein
MSELHLGFKESASEIFLRDNGFAQISMAPSLYIFCVSTEGFWDLGWVFVGLVEESRYCGRAPTGPPKKQTINLKLTT